MEGVFIFSRKYIDRVILPVMEDEIVSGIFLSEGVCRDKFFR